MNGPDGNVAEDSRCAAWAVGNVGNLPHASRCESCAGYPAVGAEIAAAGAKYVEIGLDQCHAEVNLVTCPAWPAHPSWLAKFLEVLGTKITL